MPSDPIEAARSAAELAAHQLSDGDRHAAGHIVATAERHVARRLLSQLLPGGEAQYWSLVEQEIRA